MYKPEINPETNRPWYETCDDCNYDNHVCHGCGTPLMHDNVHETDGTKHARCY